MTARFVVGIASEAGWRIGATGSLGFIKPTGISSAKGTMMKRGKRERKIKQPRQYALVEYTAYDGEKLCVFKKGSRQVFLGEIPNMPGHCVVSELKTGRIRAGYHTERFREIPEDQT